MTFVTFTNILVMMLCIAVLVQSVRILRSFRNFSDGDLKSTVPALDMATTQARAVLSELKDTLRTDCAATARTLSEAELLREELGVMIGIANAAAERIVETVEHKARPIAEATAPQPRKRRATTQPKARPAKQPAAKQPAVKQPAAKRPAAKRPAAKPAQAEAGR